MKEQEYLNYLNQLLSGRTDFTQKPHENTEKFNISTVKFEKEKEDNYLEVFNRDYVQHHSITNNDTQIYQPKAPSETHQTGNDGLIEMIDNTKTSRNSPVLKFNPAKIRKKSQDNSKRSYRQQLSKRSNSTKKEKRDLVEVRDKLVDIISFLNAKIEGNPQNVEIKKVIDMDYIKESLLPNENSRYNRETQQEGKKDLLYLPKFQLQDAKLVKSSEILNSSNVLHQQKSKQDNEFLNLKHSFDKLNDIHSSNSLQEVVRGQHQQKFHRQHAHFPQQTHEREKQPTRTHITYNSQPKPLVYINSQSQLRFPPVVKEIRPLSEIPVVRYVQRSQFNPNEPHSSNSLSKISIASRPSPSPYFLPIGQANRPIVQPHIVNWDKTPSFRMITSRPLSTQRLPGPGEARFISQNPQIRMVRHPPQIISPPLIQPTQNQNIRYRTEPIADSESKLKKKMNSSKHFKEQKQKDEETPKKILTEGEEKHQKQYKKMAEEDLEMIISPPKPYTNFSSTLDNPFKLSQTILSQSKQSSRFKADILRSIAERSQENQPSKNNEASGRSSGRMMSSVHQVLPIADIPKLQKFAGSGSTKLKRKGIDISSSKKGYLSQYTHQ